MKRILVLILFSFSLSLLQPVLAADDAAGLPRATALPLPRFVSLKADKVYIRTGPSLHYPIKWIYKREGMPVEITQEFDAWRKIRDAEGDEGWVHQSLLSGERTVMVSAPDLVPMREDARDGARMTARLEPRVIAHVEKCSGAWCRVATGGYKGWIERNSLWGIYATEELN